MRTCPVCSSSTRTKLLGCYNSPDWVLYKCQCNMCYLDSANATEEGLNKYYEKTYKSDDGQVAEKRLDAIAQFILENCQSPVLDVGGKDGKLAGRLAVMDVQTSGAGELLAGAYSTVILSHTLEHVYNVQGMLDSITNHLSVGGLVVVEVPIWGEDEDYQKYDYHLQHCNKFTVSKLEELFETHGFDVVHSMPTDHYIEYNCHRLLARLIKKVPAQVKKKDAFI